jgi:nodulation protein E
MRRVVVTGCGIVSPLGSDLHSVWEGASKGQSAIGLLSKLKFDNGNKTRHVAAEVRNFEPERHFSATQLSLMDRFAMFGVLAARAAQMDAGIEWSDEVADNAGVSMGSAYGGSESYDAGYYALFAEKANRVHPLTIPRLMNCAAASHISMSLGVRGPSVSVSTACAAATHAIGSAFRTVQHGEADVMLAGGSDAPLTLGVVKCWESLRALAGPGDAPAQACRPFSADREGLVIGEGSAVLVLEEYERARRRNARIYAEIVGFGASADAGHITQPSVDGPARAMRAALKDARIAPDQVDYINAHGTGTKLNDSAETRAIHEVFGAAAKSVSISSTKSVHGHVMGASGAIELVITLLAMRHNVVPPTANFRSPDPECDLNYTPNQPQERHIEVAISNSFAFGGLNGVLAVRRIGL